MRFVEFEEWISRCDEYERYVEIYEYCKQKTGLFLKAFEKDVEFCRYYMKECRLDSLRYLVKKGLSAQMIYILENCESDERDKLLHEVYEDDLKREAMNWEDLFLIMGQVEDAELAQLAQHFFGRKASETEKYSAWLGNKVAMVMNKNFSVIEKYYFRIVKAITEVLPEPADFLKMLEHRLKNLENSSKIYRFRIRRERTFEEYFHFLCDKEAYDAANSFLDRIWREDSGRKLFKKELPEVKEILYRVPYPSLLSFGRDYVSLRCPEYTCEDWYKDVEQRMGKDEQWQQVGKWMKVCLDVEQLYAKRSEVALKELSQTSMYDVRKYSYMTRICRQLAEIIQDWMLDDLLDDAGLIENLKLLGDKNLFSYELYDWYTFPYNNYEKIVSLNWKKMKERLVCTLDVNDLVYLYFHTPLWLRENLYEVVGIVNERLSVGQSIEDVFSQYSFTGSVVYEDKRTNTGRSRFQLIPRYLCWLRKNKAVAEMQQGHAGRVSWDGETIHVTEDWLTRHAEKLQTLSMKMVIDKQGIRRYLPTPCTFQLYEMKNDILYATDVSKIVEDRAVSQQDFEQNEMMPDNNSLMIHGKEEFRNNLNKWYQAMYREHQFIKWGKWENLEESEIVTVPEPLKAKSEAFTLDERVEIAEQLLNIIIEFARDKEEEVRRILHNCSFRPLENVNEFRYIETQHWTDFGLTPEQEERLYQKAVLLLEKMELAPDLKLEIYMNTCLKKVYPLESLIQKNEKIAELLFDPYTEWIIPVKFMGHEGSRTLFSMESVQRVQFPQNDGIKRTGKEGNRYALVVDEKKQYVIRSSYSFYYEGKISIPQDVFAGNPKGRFVMYATMKGMKEREIELNRCFLKSAELAACFPWREYKKCIYDLKKRVDEKNLIDVYEHLSRISVTFDSLNKYTQIIGELDAVFSNAGFDIEQCREIVLVLGYKNAFRDLSFLFSLPETERKIVKSKWTEQYKDSYASFLENAKGNCIEWIGTVFYLSYLQLLVDENSFWNDMAQITGKEPEEVEEELRCCKEKLEYQIERKRAVMERRCRQQLTNS